MLLKLWKVDIGIGQACIFDKLDDALAEAKQLLEFD